MGYNHYRELNELRRRVLWIQRNIEPESEDYVEAEATIEEFLSAIDGAEAALNDARQMIERQHEGLDTILTEYIQEGAHVPPDIARRPRRRKRRKRRKRG